MWIADRGPEHIERLAPDGSLLEWGSSAGDPIGMTIGPDGNLWIAGFTGGVTELSTTTPGQATYFPLTFAAGDEYVQDVASVGGKVWATVGGNAPRIESISPFGVIHDYKLSGIHPANIVAGADGAVWFSGSTTKTAVIGRLTTTGSLSKWTFASHHSAVRLAATRDAIYFTQEGVEPALMRIPVTAAPENTYVALGDSYSSGEGNAPYEQGSDKQTEPPDLCHRSLTAYGPLVAGVVGDPITSVACSGAVTNDLFAPNSVNLTERAQLLALDSNTQVVTLTVGGNDGGFPLLLEQCVDMSGWHPGFGCSANTSLANITDNRLAALSGDRDATAPNSAPIHSLLSVIRAIHARAPSAHIYFGLYPELFGTKKSRYAIDLLAPSTRACEVGSFFGEELMIDYTDAEWLDGLGKELNSVITKAVKITAGEQMAVTAVKPANFKGHGFCDSQTLWFHPLELEILHPDEWGMTPVGKVSSFHPTSVGQANGYAAAFESQIK